MSEASRCDKCKKAEASDGFWLCHYCTWNKGLDKNDLKDHLMVKNLDAIREVVKFKANVKTKKIKEPEIDMT